MRISATDTLDKLYLKEMFLLARCDQSALSLSLSFDECRQREEDVRPVTACQFFVSFQMIER